ncbi:unnamed protein product [Thlaspi arvense]|uniref:Uncharacterized protein n=1 Tax=Thlaspi arvense TaxID=13288 RepID=A0AAU9SNS1_THLAR|nr:unnamed protein product [Thlaspi arvense]
MPGTIQVSVLGLIDVQTSSSPGSSNNSIKGLNLILFPKSNSNCYGEARVSNFGFRRLHFSSYEAPRKFDCYSVRCQWKRNITERLEIETRMIIESGLLEEKLSFNGYGDVKLKMQFVLSEEDRNRIRFLRQSALRKKHEELVNGSVFTKSKSIASDLSSLSPMPNRDTVASASPKTNLGLSPETELKIGADREPVSSKLITWKPEVKETVEKTKNQPSSSDSNVSSIKKPSSKKLPEIKKPESVSLVKQEDKGFLSKPERNPKRNSMRRSMSETTLSNVRKMISNFEIKVTQETKLQTGKIQTETCKDVEEKTKAQSQQPESSVNIEKPEERKISSKDNMEKTVCKDNTERCDDIVIVPRGERTVVIEEKRLEQSTRRSDSLSKQRRKRSSVVEVKDVEKKLNKTVRLKDSQLENARGSRLWIFPDEAKNFSRETDFGTRHLDLVEANVLQKKQEESSRENIDERGFRCRSIAKMDSNNKWKNIEKSKKQKSADSESSRGPHAQVCDACVDCGGFRRLSVVDTAMNLKQMSQKLHLRW